MKDWPKFADGHIAIARWIDAEKRHAAFLIDRSDGMFSMWSERFDDHYCDYCGPSWTQELNGSLYDSEATAIAEIHAALPWTRDIQPERRTTK